MIMSPALRASCTLGSTLAFCASHTSLSSTLARPATVYGSLVFGRRFHLPYFVPGNGPIDPGPVEDPNGFDVLVSDVDDPKLRKEISETLGFQYLSRAPIFPDQKPASEIQGILYGMHNRPFFPLVTTIEGQSRPRYVHFLFDSGSPYTYFSYEVSGNRHNALLLANSL